MKKLFNLFTLLAFLSVGIMTSCQKDEVDPTLEAFAIEDDDLIQVTDDNKNVVVTVSANDDDAISSIKVEISPAAGGAVIASNTVRQITATNLNSIKVNVPFPTPDIAPNGQYNVSYTIEDGSGKKTTKSYKVNVINNQSIKFCEFGNPTLPAGKNVWVRVTVPRGADLVTATDKIYITGSFEGWTGGGNTTYALEKVSATCYQIAVNFAANTEFKFTLGDWGKEIFDAVGNPTSNFKYESGSVFEVTAYNFKTKTVVTAAVPQTLPNAAIQTSKITTVIDIANTDNAKYYLVKKGATDLTGAIEMSRVVGSSKIAGALPKGSTDEYILVREAIANKGVNRYGFEQTVKLNGVANPQNFSGINIFSTTPGFVLGDKIVIVGGGTPGDWGVSSGQDFTKTAAGKYQITIQLFANGEYLLLPNYGGWDDKWAFGSGTPLSGTFNNQGNGSNLKAPATAGNYKIEVDFTKGNGTYTLTKL